MTLSAAEKEIEDKLLATTLVDEDTVPLEIGLPHHPFEVVARSVVLTVQHGQAQQVSCGSPGTNLVRYVGAAIFTIYTEGGKGNVEAAGYAETIMTAFRNVNLGTVVCKIPYPQVRSQSGNLFSMNVFVPFTRDSAEA